MIWLSLWHGTRAAAVRILLRSIPATPGMAALYHGTKQPATTMTHQDEQERDVGSARTARCNPFDRPSMDAGRRSGACLAATEIPRYGRLLIAFSWSRLAGRQGQAWISSSRKISG